MSAEIQAKARLTESEAHARKMFARYLEDPFGAQCQRLWEIKRRPQAV